MSWRLCSLFLVVAELFLCHVSTLAQVPCLGIANGSLSFSSTLVCAVPQLYGPQGLIGLPSGSFIPLNGVPLKTLTPSNVISFLSPKQNFLLATNQTIAQQITTLPLVAPTTGISEADKRRASFRRSNVSFGPIFSERATTIGRHEVGLGFSYQSMSFESLDGVNLGSFPTLFVQAFDPAQSRACDPVQSNTCSGNTHDSIIASNRIALSINQYTAFATFGLTGRVDLSVAVPVMSVSISAATDTSIVPNSSRPGELSFNFDPPSHGSCLRTLTSTLNPQYCGEARFSTSQSSSGLGDLTVRVKGMLKSWEYSGLAAGIDLRFPTGNERDLLGSGALGIRPFFVWSHSGIISPHANLGYQWNGQSVLAGQIRTGNPDDKTKHNLPGQALYSVGMEAALTRQLTATIDVIGQVVINGARVRLVQALAPGLCESQNSCVNPGQPLQVTSIDSYNATYAAHNTSLGLRYLPFSTFLVSASVLLKMDNGGLRSKAIPTVSVTYTF